MESNSVKLTDQAHRQLKEFQEEQVNKLIKEITRDKSYPGLDEIEVTGDDIRRYSKKFYFKSKNKSSRLAALSLVYMMVGVVIGACGVFWDRLYTMFYNSPERLILVITGVFFVILSIWIFVRSLSAKEKKTIDSLDSSIF